MNEHGKTGGIIRYHGIQSHFTRTGCDLPSYPPVHLFMSTIFCFKYSAALSVRVSVISFWGSWHRSHVGVCHACLYQARQHGREKKITFGRHILPVQHTARFLSLNGRSRLNLCSCAAACHGARAGWLRRTSLSPKFHSFTIRWHKALDDRPRCLRLSLLPVWPLSINRWALKLWHCFKKANIHQDLKGLG